MKTIDLPYSTGWIRDYPDFRDYTIQKDKVSDRLKKEGEKKSVKSLLMQTGAIAAKSVSIPEEVDLSEWCSPIEDQGSLGSCTANAAIGLVEYFERRAFNKHLDASRSFLYKVTRNMLHFTGDTGAYLRSTMGALVIFGVPPEEYYPYDIDTYDEEPTAFVYSMAQSFQAVSYYRLDPFGVEKNELLKQIKINLASKLPLMFGFTVYQSISQARKTGEIPFPTEKDEHLGGHAVCAVGYDDEKTIKNSDSPNATTKGAIMIRNSWGADWGKDGYGWLPYDYVLKGLAVDWWSLVKSEWIETDNFKR